MVKVYRKSYSIEAIGASVWQGTLKRKKPLFAPAVVLYINDRLQTPCLLVVLFQLYTVEGDFV